MRKKIFLFIFLLGSLMAVVYFLSVFKFRAEIIYQKTPVIGEEVIVRFKEKITEEKARERFLIFPQVDGDLIWLAEYNELHFIPWEGFLSNQNYTVHIRNFAPKFLAAVSGKGIKKTFQPKGLPSPRLVRLADTNNIYYITQSGLKRLMPNDKIHLSYPGGESMKLEIINQETLDLYPDNILIHLDRRPEVYKLKDNQKSLIQDPRTFNKLGLDWEAIAPVNETEFAAYAEAEPVNYKDLLSSPNKQGKFIEIDLTAMEVYLFQDGRLIATYPVAAKGNSRVAPTRQGLFSIQSKRNNVFSNISRVWMPWAMQYSGAYFIHEWPYWPGGGKIKSKYSGGCIRLFEGDAKKVFDFADIGTPVLVR